MKKVLIPAHLALLSKYAAPSFGRWYLTLLEQEGPVQFWTTYLPSLDCKVIERSTCRNTRVAPWIYRQILSESRRSTWSPSFLRALRCFLLYFKKVQVDGRYDLTEQWLEQEVIEYQNGLNEGRLRSLPDPASREAKIRTVLTDISYFVFKSDAFCPDLWSMVPRFGPGSTAEGHSVISDKIDKIEGCYLFLTTLFPKCYRPVAFRLKPQMQLYLLALGSLWLSYLYFLTEKEKASRGIVIPKTFHKSRFIAAEPTVLGYCQQAAAQYLDLISDKLPGISFRDQSRNARLSLEGSKYNSYATVDLSSASDRVTKGLVEMLFPESVHNVFLFFHNDWISFQDGMVIRLLKKSRIASMGSALTFRILAFVCWFCAVASVKLTFSGLTTLEAAERVAVYGDDIIVPKECIRALYGLLSYCGLKVNEDKSFVEGPFRESCGSDCYLGSLVTPCYLREFPRNETLVRSLAHSRELRLRGFHLSAYYWEKYLYSRWLRVFGCGLPVLRSDTGFLGRYEMPTSDVDDMPDYGYRFTSSVLSKMYYGVSEPKRYTLLRIKNDNLGPLDQDSFLYQALRGARDTPLPTYLTAKYNWHVEKIRMVNPFREDLKWHCPPEPDSDVLSLFGFDNRMRSDEK